MSSELHFEVLPQFQRELWNQIATVRADMAFWEFRLAGGTALALQLGHRQSVDFDFFSRKADVGPKVLEWLKPFSGFVLRDTDKDTVHAELNQVKVSFIGGYRYGFLENPIQVEGIALASILDIGLMKLLAITHRATIRDYIDLAVIIRDRVSLDTLLECCQKKYGKSFNRMIPLRALVSFQDLDQETPILLDKAIQKTWKLILEEAVKKVSQ